MKTTRSRFLAFGLPLALIGCSGGGGSSGTGGGGGAVVTPTPTPTTAPTSTPTPTPSAGPSLLTLSADTDLFGYGSTNAYYRNGAGVLTYAPDFTTSAALQARYAAGSGSLTFYASSFAIPGTSVVGPTALVRDAAASDSDFTVYRQTAGGVEYRVRQLNIGASNAQLPLIYSNIATISTAFTDAEAFKAGAVSIAYGLQFDPARATLTGSGTYDGLFFGNARGPGGRHVYDVTGTVHYVVNYDTRSFDVQLVLSGKENQTGETVALGTYDLRPDVLRGQLDYLLVSTRDARLQSFLTGSTGAELVGGFDLTRADPLEPAITLKVTGAFAARKR